MKKQLFTGALALSMLLGTTTMAMAADAPMAAAKMTPASVNVAQENGEGQGALQKLDQVAITTTNSDGQAQAIDGLHISDLKKHTAETYSAEIKEFKEAAKAMVAAGQLTQAEADAILAQQESDLQQIKAGALTLYYAEMLDKDGQVVGKVAMASPMVAATEIDGEGTQATAYTITVADKNQNLTQLAAPGEKVIK